MHGHPCIPIAQALRLHPQLPQQQAISTGLFFQRLNTWSWWPQPSFYALKLHWITASPLKLLTTQRCAVKVGEVSETSMHGRIPLNLAPKRCVFSLCPFSFRARKHGLLRQPMPTSHVNFKVPHFSTLLSLMISRNRPGDFVTAWDGTFHRSISFLQQNWEHVFWLWTSPPKTVTRNDPKKDQVYGLPGKDIRPDFFQESCRIYSLLYSTVDCTIPSQESEGCIPSTLCPFIPT